MRIGVKPGQWGWSFAELEASWQAAEEAGFQVVSCFDHVTSSPAGLSAWDAPSLLSAMAGRTKRIRLAVDVLNSSLRHPFLLAAQIAVSQAASGGRVEVGLGAGSQHLARFDHLAVGIPFPPLAGRIQRLEACCRIFPALWRGEEVSDGAIGLHEASLGPVDIAIPPIIVGGRSRRVLEIAARYADGWNAGQVDPAGFAALSVRVDEACEQFGRTLPITKAVQIFVRDIELDAVKEHLQRLEDAGATSVVFVLDEERGPDAVRRLAQAAL